MKLLIMCAALMSVSAQAWQDVCEKDFDNVAACKKHTADYKKEEPEDPLSDAEMYSFCLGYVKATQEARKCTSKKN
ncbi:MAG: hypothetical protein IPI97_14675 [Nitrosomonas sp.]|nr:hypothetical protein [Nitrosomonas sp.]